MCDTATTMPPPLPIPSRHPARSLPIKSSGTATEATKLTSEQLDVWEHAIVLYHGFDWQTSAETFLFLSRTINRNLESTLCLLNAAMVFARCGEYSTASQILDEAEPNDQTLALTMFLMGHVEFELGNFDKAEDSFKVALHSLRGPTQQFEHLGLDYVLRASHIQQSLRIFESKNELVGMLGTLGALPADGVFEAPSRYQASIRSRDRASTVDSRSSMDSGRLPTLTDRSTPSAPASPIESVRSMEYGGDYMQWHGLPEDPDVQVTSSISKGKQPITPFDELLSGPLGKSRPSITSASTPFTKVLPALRKARQSAYEPRDARVQGDSVRGLADFIRTLPSQNKTVPKEAKVKDDSTMALAEFFRTSGPEEALDAQATNDDDASVYSQDSDRPDSMGSDDLRNLGIDKEYSTKYKDTPTPASKHHYRSGFRSMLLQENKSNAAHRRVNDTFESSSMSSDALHDLLCDGDNASLDWPLTDEASHSLRESFVSASSSRTEIPQTRATTNRPDVPEPLRPRNGSRGATAPRIPDRRSSLFRRQKSTHGGNGESSRPTSTVSSSRFFSHVANLR